MQVFTHDTQLRRPGTCGTLSVDLPVDLEARPTPQRYKLKDDIVLRNTPRSCEPRPHPQGSAANDR